MSRVSAGRSSAPPSCIGVTIATRLPFSIEHHLKKPAFYPETSLVTPTPLRKRRRPRSRAADGGEPLNYRGLRAIDAPLLEGDDRERFARELEQFALLEQEVGVRRLAVESIAGREGFVDQHAVRRQRGEQMRKQRAVKVVHHHDGVETLAGEGPVVLLEIGDPDFDPRRARERRKRGSVAIDGKDLRAACREKQRVAAVTGGEIEHAPPGGDERREAYDPGRRCQPEMTVRGRIHPRPWARSRPGSLGALFVPRPRGTPRGALSAGRSPSAASARTSSCSQSLNACASGRSAAWLARTK